MSEGMKGEAWEARGLERQTSRQSENGRGVDFIFPYASKILCYF